jgi:hypothetical protein
VNQNVRGTMGSPAATPSPVLPTSAAFNITRSRKLRTVSAIAATTIQYMYDVAQRYFVPNTSTEVLWVVARNLFLHFES